MDAPPRFVPDRERSPGTLGAVLYASPSKTFVSEAEWVALVRSVAEGDQSALHALYERAHRAVFTFVMRITANGESAEEVTLDVFHAVWQHASRYQEADGTVLGWIMNQARSRALDRLRFEQRKKRVDPEPSDSAQIETSDGETWSGLLENETKDGSVTLTTVEGKGIFLPGKQIKSHSTSKVSLMPEGLEQALSEREFLDLIEFLGSRK